MNKLARVATKPALLLAAAVAWFGMTIAPAKAYTIIQSANDVTEIDGLTILGNTYDVTFGTTPDTTFDTLSSAETAADDILAVLNVDLTDTEVGSDADQYFVCSSVPAADSCLGEQVANESDIVGGWNDVGTHSGPTGVGISASNPAAEFTLVTAATPEPISLGTILIGFAAMAWAVERKRRISS